MKTIGAYEAKIHLPDLLDRVAEGERFIITRHGAPVAMIVPIEQAEKVQAKDLARELKASMQKRVLDGLTIRKWIEEGRR